MPSLEADIKGKEARITERSIRTLTDDKLMVFFKNEFKINK